MSTSTSIRLLDALERLFWTFVSGFLSSLLSVPLIVEILERSSDVDIDLSVLGTAALGAVISGLLAVANAVLLIARWRLNVLPNPGSGMPGAAVPRDDVGLSLVETILLVVVVVLALYGLYALFG